MVLSVFIFNYVDFLQDLLVNPTGGYLDNAIKYHNRILKTHSIETDDIAEAVCDTIANLTLENAYTEEQAVEDLRILKGTVVNAQNMNEIKLKLTKTTEYRKKMMTNKETDLRVEFPYFFTHPHLV